MIIKEIINILGDINYKVYSDKNKVIRNKTTGIEYSSVMSCIDYEYEETEQDIEVVEDPTNE